MAIEFRKEGPWELPDGWVWARLGGLGRWTGGGTPSKANPAFWQGGTIPWVSPKDMKVDVIDETVDSITTNAVLQSSTKLIPENSVLMVVRSGILNHTFPVAVSARQVTLNQDMRALTPLPGIDPRYLCYLLKRMQRHILDVCSKDGTTVASVEPAKLEETWVPIAPAGEQQRIVARIDALFTEIADGETALARARTDLDTWRRALLKAAVTGELTREWRETNRSNETACDVLNSIRGTRIGLRDNTSNQAQVSSTMSDLPLLPSRWAWATLGEISESVRNGTSQAPRAEKNEHEILRISAVRPMRIDASQIRYLSTEQAKSALDSVVQPGDILFTRYNGSSDLVGVGAIYRGSPRFYPDKLIRIRLRPELLSYAKYIEVAANTWISRKHISRNIKTTAGQQGISGESLKQTPIPLPPLSEVKEILAVLEGARDDIDDELSVSTTGAIALRQSVLKLAFEGQLSDQDPRDEPAHCLLARLSTSLETASPPRRARAARASSGAQ